MTKLRTIAKAGGWEVIQDLNGVISIHFGNGRWICNHAGAYEAIRDEVKDPETRTALLKQWTEDQEKVKYAEETAPLVEALLGKKAAVKYLTEELQS